MPVSFERWLEFALQDLDAGQRFAGQIAPHIVCFHAQQAAEKALKAVIVHRGDVHPRTHDLLTLRGLMPKMLQEQLDDASLTWLTGFAVHARYADDLSEVTPDDATDALRIAADVVARVRAHLGAPDATAAATAAGPA